jgi:4-diphosphocytidyl-2-C-methyl-D-erythritol kinase
MTRRERWMSRASLSRGSSKSRLLIATGAPLAPTVPIRVRAHAKINLDLRVSDRHIDGFHELRTILQSIALHDVITLRATQGPCRVRCSAPGVPEGEDNLVWRVVHQLWAALGRDGEPHGVTVSITKRIPIAAGLGGGTADAVAALHGLCRLWGVSPAPACLREIAGAVGSDGPFFLVGGTALGLGRGDEVYPLAELPRHWVVVAVPRRGVSTVSAYAWMDRDRAAASVRRRRPRVAAFWSVPPVVGPVIDLAALTNDLEPSVARRRPEIRTAARVMAATGATVAAMTGSGSAVFGLFLCRTRATEAARQLRAEGGIALVTRTLERATLVRDLYLSGASR